MITMMMMDVYPFFLECSKNEIGARRKKLQQLAFGKGGLFLKRKNHHVLVVDGGEFVIPKHFTHKSYIPLRNILWPDDDYYRLQKAISEAKKLWVNVKKDRLHLIDEYILTQSSGSIRSRINNTNNGHLARGPCNTTTTTTDNDDRGDNNSGTSTSSDLDLKLIYSKAVITMALILKLITSADIEYSDRRIISIHNIKSNPTAFFSKFCQTYFNRLNFVVPPKLDKKPVCKLYNPKRVQTVKSSLSVSCELTAIDK